MPKTIDNDIVETTMTFGFDTAVSFATDAIDRLHTTAEAHHRVMVVEVMGRYAGWIALYAGIAGGADVMLIPEIPFDLEKVAERIRERERWGARFSIVVVAEGAHPERRRTSIVTAGTADRAERLGGIGEQVSRPRSSNADGKGDAHVVLGHLQRGGAPSSYDRMLATRFGGFAVDSIDSGRVRRDDGSALAGHRRRAARACGGAHAVCAARQRPRPHGAEPRHRLRRLDRD